MKKEMKEFEKEFKEVIKSLEKAVDDIDVEPVRKMTLKEDKIPNLNKVFKKNKKAKEEFDGLTGELFGVVEDQDKLLDTQHELIMDMKESLDRITPSFKFVIFALIVLLVVNVFFLIF